MTKILGRAGFFLPNTCGQLNRPKNSNAATTHRIPFRIPLILESHMTSFSSKYVRAMAVVSMLGAPMIATSAAHAQVDITQTGTVVTNTGRMDFINSATGGTDNVQVNGVLVNNVNGRSNATIRQVGTVVTNTGRMNFSNTATGGTRNTQANGVVVNNVTGG